MNEKELDEIVDRLTKRTVKILIEKEMLPNKSSLEMSINGKGQVTWKIKIYDDDDERGFKRACEQHKRMLDKYGMP